MIYQGGEETNTLARTNTGAQPWRNLSLRQRIAAAIRAKSIKASKLAHFALTVTMSVAAYMDDSP
uniref:Uncharacterized protein n=1 Tax=Oryza nivara TaxID=4536 RepID=A0A0E0GD58_ORYNI